MAVAAIRASAIWMPWARACCSMIPAAVAPMDSDRGRIRNWTLRSDIGIEDHLGFLGSVASCSRFARRRDLSAGPKGADPQFWLCLCLRRRIEERSASVRPSLFRDKTTSKAMNVGFAEVSMLPIRCVRVHDSGFSPDRRECRPPLAKLRLWRGI